MIGEAEASLLPSTSSNNHKEDITLLRLASAPKCIEANKLYKTGLLVIAAGSYWIWFLQENNFASHKYLTIIGCLFTFITRLVCAIEIFVSKPNPSLLRNIASLMQNSNFAVECFILIFYWVVISWYDYTVMQWGLYDHVYNIILHIAIPMVACGPVFLEYTQWCHKTLFMLTVPFGLGYLLILIIYAMRTGEGVYHPLFTFRDVLSYVLIAVAGAMLVGCYYLGWHISNRVGRSYPRVWVKKESGRSFMGGYTRDEVEEVQG